MYSSCTFHVVVTYSSCIFHTSLVNRIAQRVNKLFVITSDKEKAIQTGLRVSRMNTYSVQFFCGLHAKWNVRDHKCSNGQSFGKKASESWVRRMQHAEGPKAFQIGYEKMKTEFDDPSRIEYIETLYGDETKAYFKRDMHFSNAVLVDVCEILFSAVSTWVGGSSRKSTSLLMALVRIVEGCRSLSVRPFLNEPQKTIAHITRKTMNYDVTKMFKFLSCHLTRWAVQRMYDLFDQSWTRYTVHHVESNDTTVVFDR